MQKLILNYPSPSFFTKTNILYSKEWIFENFDFENDYLEIDD